MLPHTIEPSRRRSMTVSGAGFGSWARTVPARNDTDRNRRNAKCFMVFSGLRSLRRRIGGRTRGRRGRGHRIVLDEAPAHALAERDLAQEDRGETLLALHSGA